MFTGASEGIRAVMKLMTNPEGASTKKPGVMIPIPQYPLYSASLAEYNMEQVRNLLSKAATKNGVLLTFPGWVLSGRVKELGAGCERAGEKYKGGKNEAGSKFFSLLFLNKCLRCKVRAIVIINPGNPTGQVRRTIYLI